MSNFGEILKEVGEFGLFQKRLLLALCIPSMFAAFDVISQVFTGMSFQHHCNTDWILERGPNLTDERQKNLTIPVNKDGKFENCQMFTPVDWDLETIEIYGISNTSECVNGWDYEAPTGASTLVTEVSKQTFRVQNCGSHKSSILCTVIALKSFFHLNHSFFILLS